MEALIRIKFKFPTAKTMLMLSHNSSIRIPATLIVLAADSDNLQHDRDFLDSHPGTNSVRKPTTRSNRFHPPLISSMAAAAAVHHRCSSTRFAVQITCTFAVNHFEWLLFRFGQSATARWICQIVWLFAL